MTEQEVDRLLKAYRQLEAGEWPEEVLGDMPDYPDKRLVRWNAEDAIEAIVGDAAISRFHHMKNLGKTEAEWLRWYTVERFRYGEVSRRSYKNAGVSPWTILITVLLTAIAIVLPVVLQELLGLKP